MCDFEQADRANSHGLFIFYVKKEMNLQQNTEKYAKRQVGTLIAITFQWQISELHKIFVKEQEK